MYEKNKNKNNFKTWRQYHIFQSNLCLGKKSVQKKKLKNGINTIKDHRSATTTTLTKTFRHRGRCDNHSTNILSFKGKSLQNRGVHFQTGQNTNISTKKEKREEKKRKEEKRREKRKKEKGKNGKEKRKREKRETVGLWESQFQREAFLFWDKIELH